MRKGRLPSFTARTVVSATLLLIVVTVLAPRERGVAAFPRPERGVFPLIGGGRTTPPLYLVTLACILLRAGA